MNWGRGVEPFNSPPLVHLSVQCIIIKFITINLNPLPGKFPQFINQSINLIFNVAHLSNKVQTAATCKPQGPPQTYIIHYSSSFINDKR